jgi:hypothetical protein
MFVAVEPGEDTLGLLANENHRVARWNSDEGRIYFSWTRKGNAISIHLSSDKRGLRHLRKTSGKFCEWILDNHEWCEMLIVQFALPSIERMVRRLGFEYLVQDSDGMKAYARSRQWAA